MMARGFKPVGWVAGVAAAALSCYMLSLNVAAERAELKKLEWKIVMAKRDIRSLETELGTRGRLEQLESWNADVLALSAPTSGQFIDNAVVLARFDQRGTTLADTQVRLASVPAIPAPAPRIQAPVHLASASVDAPAASLVRKASLILPDKVEAEPVAKPKLKPGTAIVPEPTKKLAETKAEATPKKKSAKIDDKLVSDIRAAAKAESKGGAGGQ